MVALTGISSSFSLYRRTFVRLKGRISISYICDCLSKSTIPRLLLLSHYNVQCTMYNIQCLQFDPEVNLLCDSLLLYAWLWDGFLRCRSWRNTTEIETKNINFHSINKIKKPQTLTKEAKYFINCPISLHHVVHVHCAVGTWHRVYSILGVIGVSIREYFTLDFFRSISVGCNANVSFIRWILIHEKKNIFPIPNANRGKRAEWWLDGL